MKKILVLLLALVLAVTVFSLVACGDPETTTTPQTTTTAKPSSTTSTPQTTTSAKPVVTTTTPVVTTPATTTPVTTTEAAKPTMRDPAGIYHIESTVVKTNQKGEDYDYLLDSTAGQNNNERFADGEGYILYQFDFSGMIEPTVTFKLRQQYKVYVTDNLDDYMEDCQVVADFMDIIDTFPSTDFNEEGAYVAGGNTIDITVDPYAYGYYGTFYVYIANAQPQFGWGGTISQFTINEYVEGEGPEVTTIDNSNGTPQYASGSMTETIEEILVPGPDEDDAKYIFENTSAMNNENTRRYCDNNAYLIYRIDLRQLVQPTVELFVIQNYKVEISLDCKDWIEIANYGTSDDYKTKYETSGTDTAIFNPSGDYLTGDNGITLTINPYDHEIYGNLYIRISDCFPSAGWGGAVEKLTIKSWVEN